MKQIIKDMKNSYQVENKQTILQHGLLVFKYTVDLLNVLEGKQSKYDQKVPQWIIDDSEYIKNRLSDYKTIKHYCIWHDLGKPYCKPDS